jgi:hypothetical protein
MCWRTSNDARRRFRAVTSFFSASMARRSAFASGRRTSRLPEVASVGGGLPERPAHRAARRRVGPSGSADAERRPRADTGATAWGLSDPRRRERGQRVFTTAETVLDHRDEEFLVALDFAVGDVARVGMSWPGGDPRPMR